MYIQNTPIGSNVVIVSFSVINEVTKRLNEMGILIGSKVKVVRKSPFNGPVIIEHNFHKIAIRCSEEFQISVRIES